MLASRATLKRLGKRANVQLLIDLVRRLRIFGQRDKLRLSGPKRGRDKWA